MSSVNRNSPRLRDIMAAFNIPDQEELATRGSTTPMSEVNTPAISNMSMMPHSSASTHSALAGCVPSSSPVTSIPMSSHSGSPVPIVPSPRLSSPYAASVHQQSPAAAYVAAGTVPTLHGKSPLIQQSVPAPVMAGSFSHSMAGPKSAPALPSIASLAQSSIHQPHPLPPAISQSHGQAAQPHHTQGPALAPPGSLGPPVYKNGPSGYQAIQSEFHPAYCHQHEEAIEYYARNQPEQLLVYSAEDWPAPESVASNHPDSSRAQGKALPPYSQGSGAPEAGGSSSQPARNQPMHGSVSPAVSSSAGKY
ncbi:uncharacterized protein [Diadema setosum]|uniref:uncharacterized protein n=1 Tax=Diadema setosum TaxID=31175 RepID=UPI003B3A5CDC